MRSSSKYQQIRKEAPRNAPGRGNAQATGVVRHFAGKRGAAAVSDSDDSDDDQDEEEDEEEEQEETPNDTTSTYAGQEAGENGQVEEEKEPALKPKMMIKPITVKITDRPPEPPVVKVKPVQAPEKPMQRSSIKAAPPPESSSEEEDDSEEEDSSSESDAPVLVKPTFISKAKRAQAATNKPVVAASTKPAATNTDDDAAAAAKRKEQTLALAEHSLQHQADLEALLQQTTALDAELAKVDDTDDTDPAAERAAWRLRELARLQRDREALVERERAREELETLRESTTEQQREAEAIARRRQREQDEQDAKRKAGEDQSSGNYMQRYYHKGAFFQEDEFIKNRDFSGALEDDYHDKRILPKALQARTSGEVGLRGRTKYRSLAEEDTSRGALWDVATRGPRPRDRGPGERDYDDERDGRDRHRRESHEPRDPEGEEAYRKRREL